MNRIRNWTCIMFRYDWGNYIHNDITGTFPPRCSACADASVCQCDLVHTRYTSNSHLCLTLNLPLYFLEEGLMLDVDGSWKCIVWERDHIDILKHPVVYHRVLVVNNKREKLVTQVEEHMAKQVEKLVAVFKESWKVKGYLNVIEEFTQCEGRVGMHFHGTLEFLQAAICEGVVLDPDKFTYEAVSYTHLTLPTKA